MRAKLAMAVFQEGQLGKDEYVNVIMKYMYRCWPQTIVAI